jgi:hypothetical protein
VSTLPITTNKYTNTTLQQANTVTLTNLVPTSYFCAALHCPFYQISLQEISPVDDVKDDEQQGGQEEEESVHSGILILINLKGPFLHFLTGIADSCAAAFPCPLSQSIVKQNFIKIIIGYNMDKRLAGRIGKNHCGGSTIAGWI